MALDLDYVVVVGGRASRPEDLQNFSQYNNHQEAQYSHLLVRMLFCMLACEVIPAFTI